VGGAGAGDGVVGAGYGRALKAGPVVGYFLG